MFTLLIVQHFGASYSQPHSLGAVIAQLLQSAVLGMKQYDLAPALLCALERWQSRCDMHMHCYCTSPVTSLSAVTLAWPCAALISTGRPTNSSSSFCLLQANWFFSSQCHPA